jgi:hypothetical protein
MNLRRNLKGNSDFFSSIVLYAIIGLKSSSSWMLEYDILIILLLVKRTIKSSITRVPSTVRVNYEIKLLVIYNTAKL